MADPSIGILGPSSLTANQVDAWFSGGWDRPLQQRSVRVVVLRRADRCPSPHPVAGQGGRRQLGHVGFPERVAWLDRRERGRVTLLRSRDQMSRGPTEHRHAGSTATVGTRQKNAQSVDEQPATTYSVLKRVAISKPEEALEGATGHAPVFLCKAPVLPYARRSARGLGPDARSAAYAEGKLSLMIWGVLADTDAPSPPATYRRL